MSSDVSFAWRIIMQAGAWACSLKVRPSHAPPDSGPDGQRSAATAVMMPPDAWATAQRAFSSSYWAS